MLLTFPSEIASTAENIRSLAASLGDVSGKVVIDVTNPLVKGELGELHYAGESSGGEEFAKALPSAHVFKAFNTVCSMKRSEPFRALQVRFTAPRSAPPLQIGVRHMADPSGPVAGAAPLDMMFAGSPDAASKAIMSTVISAVGFHPVYVGPIRYSRNLEAIAELVSADDKENRCRAGHGPRTFLH